MKESKFFYKPQNPTEYKEPHRHRTQNTPQPQQQYNNKKLGSKLKNNKLKSQINIEIRKCHFELLQPSAILTLSVEVNITFATVTSFSNHTRFVKSFAIVNHTHKAQILATKRRKLTLARRTMEETTTRKWGGSTVKQTSVRERRWKDNAQGGQWWRSEYSEKDFGVPCCGSLFEYEYHCCELWGYYSYKISCHIQNVYTWHQL